LNEDQCKTVITGQQIGLLGGPLYTTYKVLGAVFLARELKGKAVYWLETNDADFNEINHIDYLDKDNQLQRLTWDIHSDGYSCGLIEVDDHLIQLLGRFFDTIRQTEYTPLLRDMVFDSYVKGQTLGQASVTLAWYLFGSFDLQLFTPGEPAFRDFSRAILLKEAHRTPEGEQCNLFCMIGNQRKTIFKKDGTYILRDGSEADLSVLPLVPNVKTRNICQDAYFNAHAYVAGPGEVKYIAQLDDAYEFHGVKKAAVRPRMSLTLLEPKVRRLLDKTGLTLEQVTAVNKEELVKLVLKEKTEGGLDFNQRLQEALTSTEAYLTGLEGLGFDPSDIKGIRKYLRPEMKTFNGKLRAKEKEKHQRLLTDVSYLADALLPQGNRQERVFNIFYYMNLYGVELLQHIYENHDWKRQILEVEHGD